MPAHRGLADSGARHGGAAPGPFASATCRGSRTFSIAWRRTLAQRLSRYGFCLSGGALAAALTRRASATVPAPLLVSTMKVASGKAAAAMAAVALSKEVVTKMFLAKLKLVVGSVLAHLAHRA